MDEEQVQHAQEEPPINQTPEVLKDLFGLVIYILQRYGWYLLIGLIVVLYFKDRVLQRLSRLTSSLQGETNTHRYDDETAVQRLEALEASRRRLQEQMDAQAARHAEEMKKKEEEKRAQKIEDWERHREGKGYRSKYRPPTETDGAAASGGSSTTAGAKKKKNVYRPADYNPLLGSGGGGACFRPERRGGGGGGGA